MTRLAPPASATSDQTADGTTIVTLNGDFDLANASATRYRVEQILAGCRSALIVDLRGVSFADSTLLSTLLVALRQAEAHRQHLVLIRPNPDVWKAFTISGLDRRVPACNNIAEAVAQLSAARSAQFQSG
jgi:anti-anti-sigma factor